MNCLSNSMMLERKALIPKIAGAFKLERPEWESQTTSSETKGKAFKCPESHSHLSSEG